MKHIVELYLYTMKIYKLTLFDSAYYTMEYNIFPTSWLYNKAALWCHKFNIPHPKPTLWAMESIFHPFSRPHAIAQEPFIRKRWSLTPRINYEASEQHIIAIPQPIYSINPAVDKQILTHPREKTFSYVDSIWIPTCKLEHI